ncbi:GPW/gp25 family protein [Sphingobium sp. H39-3-25]|jgi:phage baseplate assembly protein W|uniref:GPW/gp25 family protein n=1 Tax=Sphingobium arseniciresistens TaxID=3030834 RepID=UPI0023B8A198|nr:GPW/gp25 family protein [Sphingobium arseniciresistens]
MTDVSFPYRFNALGRTAAPETEAEHVRDLIMQLLFTAPGERVMRPDFGTGLPQLLFGPASPDLAAATQMLVQGALQQWLGDRIEAREVRVTANDSAIEVLVSYALRSTGELRSDVFRRETGA